MEKISFNGLVATLNFVKYHTPNDKIMIEFLEKRLKELEMKE